MAKGSEIYARKLARFQARNPKWSEQRRLDHGRMIKDALINRVDKPGPKPKRSAREIAARILERARSGK